MTTKTASTATPDTSADAEVEYVVQRRQGDGTWEVYEGYPQVTSDIDTARNMLASAEDDVSRAMDDAFSAVKSPAEARAAADRYERLQATELRLAKRVVSPYEQVW